MLLNASTRLGKVTLAGPITVGADGTWTATATSGELSGLPANGTVTVTANVSDLVGLAAPQATAQVDTTKTRAPAMAYPGNAREDEGDGAWCFGMCAK